MSFTDEFVKSSKKHYNYDHSKINFRDKRSAVNSINEWAAKSTNGKLPEITKDVENADGAMIVNAMFFKRKYNFFLLIHYFLKIFSYLTISETVLENCACVIASYILSHSSLGSEIP